MYRSIRLPIPLLLATLPWLLVACGDPKAPAPPGPGTGMPPMEVEVVTVAPRDIERSVELPGRLESIRKAEVRARVEGILEKRLFTEGSTVTAGMPLFHIDPRTLQAQVDSARAALARAEANREIAAQTLERMRALVESRAVSQQELDQATAQDKLAAAEVAAARAALVRAEIDLSHATVTAPISGRIGRALASEGALVGRGEATPLAAIEQMDPIWVNFSQASADFLRLRAAARRDAQRAEVRLILDSGHVYSRPGRLVFTDAVVDPATGSVAMKAEFPNPRHDLLPGQFVRVRLPVGRLERVITVPQRAVLAGPQGQMVMLVNDQGLVEPRPVKTSGLAGSEWIIESGLAGGEQVIVEGVQKVRPGMPVRARPQDTPAQEDA